MVVETFKWWCNDQTVASRVAEEMDVKLGEEVGYTIRFEDVTNPVRQLTSLYLVLLSFTFYHEVHGSCIEWYLVVCWYPVHKD
jgi:hypothetical protein